MLRSVHAQIFVIALFAVVVACGNATPGDAAAPGKNEAQAAAPATKESKKEAKRKKQPDVALSNSEIRHAFDRLSGGGSTWTPR
jgi:hypothetical protein